MSSPSAQLDEATLETLLAAARRARANAYAPYSGYPVGAALLSDSGAVHAGANVENAAYPSGQCAEASALGAMIASEGEHRLRAVLVLTGGPRPGWPCGNCRQKLAEFAAADTAVFAATADGTLRRLSLDELLPERFSRAELEPHDA